MNKILLAAAAALTIAGPALAAPAGADQSLSVSGVNFNNAADVDAVYARITRAAATACDSYAAQGRVSAAARTCADRAVAQAVKALDRPVLTAMHQSRTLNQPHHQMASR